MTKPLSANIRASSETRWWRGGYGRLLASQGVSAIGDRISYVVVPFCLLAVGVSPTAVAMVLGARAVGYALVVLYGGVLADRLNRRKIMVGSDLVRLVTQSATAMLVFTHYSALLLFLGLQFVYGVAEGVFRPAASGIMPDLVPEEHLERANGLSGSVITFGMVAGPALGGVMVAAGLSAIAIALDAVSFALSALLLTGLPNRMSPARGRRVLLGDVREGWQHLMRRRWLLILTATSAVFHFAALSAVFSLGPIVADQQLGGAKVWGVLVTVFGVGGVMGGMLTAKVTIKRPALACVVLLAVLSGQPLFLASGLPIAVIAVLQFCAGASLTVFSGVLSGTTQRFVPQEVLSRVSSFDLLASTSLLPLGYFVLGGLAGAIGAAPAMRLAGTVTALLCLMALLSSSVRGLRKTEGTTG